MTIYDDQTGGSYHVIVHFGPNHTARILTLKDDLRDDDVPEWPTKRDINVRTITVD